MGRGMRSDTVSVQAVASHVDDERARVDACLKEVNEVLQKHRCVINGTVKYNSAPDNWIQAVPQFNIVPIHEKTNGKPE